MTRSPRRCDVCGVRIAVVRGWRLSMCSLCIEPVRLAMLGPARAGHHMVTARRDDRGGPR